MKGAHSANSTRDEIVAVDLGSRITKAVCMRRRGSDFVLVDYALVDSPLSERELSAESLAEQLRKAVRALKTNCRRVVVSLDAEATILTQLDLPPTSASDLRKMVRLSPKTYLQQDLKDHLFDCYFRRLGKTGDTSTSRRRRSRILVGAARRRTVEDLVDAGRRAGLNVVEVTPAPVALANGFRLVRDDSHPDAVALLDIGAAHSTISVVFEGDVVLTRSLPLGADKFADVLSPDGRAKLEGEEDINPEALQTKVQRAVLAFAREVDASVSFFHSQFEKNVNQLFVSGGTARSQFLIQMMESELNFSCEPLNLIRQLVAELPETRVRELEYEMPQLLVAVGAAVGALRDDAIRINFLAEEQEAEELRRRDPVRRTMLVAAAVLVLMLGWAGFLGVNAFQERRKVKALELQLATVQTGGAESLSNMLAAVKYSGEIGNLERQAADRFLFGPLLNALQFVVPDEIEFHRVSLERRVKESTIAEKAAPAAAGSRSGPRKKSPASTKVHEEFVLTLFVRNYGNEATLQKLTSQIASNDYFKPRLRATKPVELVSEGKPQFDPRKPEENRRFTLCTIECTFQERIF